MKWRGIFFFMVLICLALVGCSSLDEGNAPSGQKPETVPGEVNPDAPDAAQTMRTTPGWNF